MKNIPNFFLAHARVHYMSRGGQSFPTETIPFEPMPVGALDAHIAHAHSVVSGRRLGDCRFHFWSSSNRRMGPQAGVQAPQM